MDEDAADFAKWDATWENHEEEWEREWEFVNENARRQHDRFRWGDIARARLANNEVALGNATNYSVRVLISIVSSFTDQFLFLFLVS